MSFSLPCYQSPDFSLPALQTAPDAALSPAPLDGVAPENYHSTSMYTEYFKVGGRWLLAEESRMDCTAVLREGRVEIVEFRNLHKGDLVFTGRSEDGSEGILLWTAGFADAAAGAQESFAFRQGRSRETGYTRDYNELAQLLRYEKDHGNILWVMGPACSFDAGARRAFAALVGETTGLPVELWDERRTTVDAHRILSDNGVRGKKRKNTVDAVAASLILEGYLNRRRSKV